MLLWGSLYIVSGQARLLDLYAASSQSITIVSEDCGGAVSSSMIPGTQGHGFSLIVLCVLDKG